MKKSFIIIVSMCLAYFVNAQQKHTIKFENIASNKIEIMLGGKVTIKGHARNEIIIESPDFNQSKNHMEDDKEELPEKAKGLKPLSDLMQENALMGLTISEGEKEVSIEDIMNRGRYSYIITLPDKVRLKFTRVDHKASNDINISGLNGEVNIEVINGNLLLTRVSGPVVATTVNGDMEVVYDKLNATNPNSFTSINGDLDITLDANAKADVAMSTIQGKAYTDFEIQTNKENASSLKPINEDGEEMFSLSGKINGGGTRINFSTVNGDIFLRKQ